MTTPQDAVLAIATKLDGLADDAHKALANNPGAPHVAACANAVLRTPAQLRAIPWDQPPGPPPPPPPPPTGLRPLGYNPDNGPTGIDQAKAIGAWQGVPLGAYNVFQYGHKSAQMFVQSYTKQGWTPFRTVPILAHLGLMPILTIPGSVGDESKPGPDVSYADVAAGALDAEHKGNAAFIAGSGDWKTDIALRISRECDTHGPWYYGDTPADRANFCKAMVHLFNDIYAPALGEQAVLVICVTKRADDTSWPDAIPLGDVPASRLKVSIDAYLNKPQIDTPQGFSDNWLRFVEPKVNWALGKGLQVAFSEYAVTDIEQPGNMQRLLSFMDGLHQGGHLHHQHYFGTGDRHALFGQTKFPQTAAAYVEFWKGR